MKKIISLISMPAYVTLCIFFAGTTYLQARNIFPQIDQIKSKVEAINTTTPNVNLGDLLASAKTEYDEHGVAHKILSLDPTAYETFEGLEKEFNETYWCRQDALLKQLQDTIETSKKAAAEILYAQIQKRYTGNQKILVTFAGDLFQEDAKLQSLVTRTLKKIGDLKSSKNTAGISQLNALLNSILKSHNTLQALTTVVNTILVYSLC